MTFLACALHQLFVRSCDLAHRGLCCSHVCVCTHHSSQHLPFRCLPSQSFSAHMDEPQGMRLPLGTTEWNHSYYTVNQLSALHSLEQLQAGATSPSPVQISAFTQESIGTLSPEGCIFVRASPPPQQPVPTPPLDAPTQTSTHRCLFYATSFRSSWLHFQRMMFSALRVLDQFPRYLLMRRSSLFPLVSPFLDERVNGVPEEPELDLSEYTFIGRSALFFLYKSLPFPREYCRGSHSGYPLQDGFCVSFLHGCMPGPVKNFEMHLTAIPSMGTGR